MQRKLILLILFALLLLALFYPINSIELRAEEPRRAIVSAEMVLSGNYIVPQINGMSYYNKPPVFNWVMASFYHLFGSFDEWVVRLPSLLSFLAMGVLNFFVVRKYLNFKTALYSSLFLLTCGDLFFYGTTTAGEIDLFFSLVVFLQIVSIFHFYHQRKFLLMFLVSYTLTAIGVLTKGPPSLAFQALTLLGFMIYEKRFLLLLSWQHFTGIVMLFLLAGGYFYVYSSQDEVIPYMVNLFMEASQRTGTEGNIKEIVVSTLLFPIELLKLMLPWSLLVVVMIRKKLWHQIKANKYLAFSAIFILVNIPIYWFTAELRSRYIYMFFPFFLVPITHFFVAYISKKETNIYSEKVLPVFLFVVAVAVNALSFVPDLQQVNYMELKLVAVSLLLLAIVIAYKKLKSERLLLLVLFVVGIRMAINVSYFSFLTTHADWLVYRTNVEELLKVTREEPIHWAGIPYQFEPKASIGPVNLKKSTLTTAPLLAYQIPYYITKNNGHIMQYDKEMVKGQYYLAPDWYIKNMEVEIYGEIPDNWTKQNLQLVKLK